MTKERSGASMAKRFEKQITFNILSKEQVGCSGFLFSTREQVKFILTGMITRVYPSSGKLHENEQSRKERITQDESTRNEPVLDFMSPDPLSRRQIHESRLSLVLLRMTVDIPSQSILELRPHSFQTWPMF